MIARLLFTTSSLRRAASRALIASVAVALAACGSDPVSVGTGESLTVARFTTLESAAAQGTRIDTTRRRTTITDAAAWGTFWTSLIPDPQATGPAPSVDFSREMVIAAVMPLRPSSGYRIAIEHVTEFADHIEAEVVERSPAPGCVTLTVITRPFDVVRVPRRDKPVTFVERTVETPCTDGANIVGDTVRAAFGKPVTARTVQVTLVKLVNESRCAMNAICIWAGDATVVIRFAKNGQTTDVTLHTNSQGGPTTTNFAGVDFRLIGLTPYPVMGQAAPNEAAYTAILVAR
jgi:hypothetical protein